MRSIIGRESTKPAIQPNLFAKAGRDLNIAPSFSSGFQDIFCIFSKA
jgi:hypothetical protein